MAVSTKSEAKDNSVVLVAVDLSPVSKAVMESALRVTGARATELHLLHVLRPQPPELVATLHFATVVEQDEFLRTSMVLDYGKSTEQVLPVVMDGSACRPNGWFYNSAEAPAYGIFCPATCDLLLQNPDRNVTALLGCR